MFFQKDVRSIRDQNIKHCGFIKDRAHFIKEKTQNTTGFVNKDTMIDMLQKRKMK